MKFIIIHTANLFLMTISFLLLTAPAKTQTIVNQGKITSLSVKEVPGYFYEWELYTDSTINFALVPGNCPVTSANLLNGNKGSQVSVQWLKTGIYFFKITAHDPNNCAMNLKIGIVKVIPPEVRAVITGDSVIGGCQHAKLDASKSIGNIVKYEWSLISGGGILSSLNGISTEFYPSSSDISIPANVKVALKLTDNLGSTDSDTINVQIDPLPTTNILTNSNVEKDGTMTIDGSQSIGKGISFRWFTEDGKIIGNNNQALILANGPGSYSLEVTDIHGCISQKSVTFPNPNLLIATNDYGRTSWEKDITIPILSNDFDSNNDINSASVKIISNPLNGVALLNKDKTVTYHPTIKEPGKDQFVYEICNSLGFCDSAQVIIDIHDAALTTPEAFSPNGDGLNETLIFKGLENYPQSQLYVYTRGGQLVYQSIDYLNDWNGKMIKNNQSLPTGTYYYILKLGGTNRIIKGFVFIKY